MRNVQSAAAAANTTPGTIQTQGHVGERLLRLPQVLDMVGLGKTMVYEMVKKGEFPQPRKVRHLSVWVESEVQTWVGKIAEVPTDA
jgi:prophage regulatory protein